MKAKDKNGRKRGRPQAELQQYTRQKIIEAASSLFEIYDFRNVTVRNIADQAHVNSAMVSYYFKSKNGLLFHMFCEVVDELAERLQNIIEKKETGVEGFIREYSEVLSKNTWFAVFIAKEIYFGTGGMREQAVKYIQAHVSPRLIALIETDMAAGRYKTGVDPRIIVITISGLAAYPFLVRKGLSFSLNDKETLESIIKTNTGIFLNGILAEHS